MNPKCQAFLIISLFALFPCSIHAESWDSMDKTLFGTLIVSKAIDCLQTQDIFDSPEYYELNPIIVEGVDRFGKAFIPIYFIGTTLITGLITDWLPSNYRKAWLGVWVGRSLTTIHRNYKVGIGFSF